MEGFFNEVVQALAPQPGSHPLGGPGAFLGGFSAGTPTSSHSPQMHLGMGGGGGVGYQSSRPKTAGTGSKNGQIERVERRAFILKRPIRLAAFCASLLKRSLCIKCC